MNYVKQDGVELTWASVYENGMSGLSNRRKSKIRYDLRQQLRDLGIRAKVTFNKAPNPIYDTYLIIKFYTPEDEAMFIMMFNK